MNTLSIVNFCNAESIVNIFNAEMNNPKLLGKHTLVGVGILIGGQKVVQLSAAALTTVGAKITGIYNKGSNTNKWFHKNSHAYIASSKQHLVRDLTVAAVMIGAGLSIDVQEVSGFDGVKNTVLNGLFQVKDFCVEIPYKAGSAVINNLPTMPSKNTLEVGAAMVIAAVGGLLVALQIASETLR